MSTTTRSESPVDPSITGAENSTALVTSTPSKARIFSQSYTWGSVGPELKQDVENYTCSNIDFPKFIRFAFGLDDKDYAARIKKIQGWAIHEEQGCKNALDKFMGAKGESSMYRPFEEMGNMILKRAADEYKIKNGVKLLVLRERIIRGGFGFRKPDVLLVPEDVILDPIEKNANTAKEGVVEEQSSSAKGKMPQPSVSYHQILMPFEFKLGGNASGKSHATSVKAGSSKGSNSSRKRKRSPVGVGSGGASKRQSNSSNKSAKIGGSGSRAFSVRPSEGDGQGESGSSSKQVRSPPFHSGDASAPEGRSIGSTDQVRLENASGSGLAVPPIVSRLRPQAHQKDVKVQLASYVAELLSVREDRSFVFGVRVIGSSITVCFYHRSAIIEADAFDLTENPEYFAIFLTMFHRDLPTFGFNEYMGYCNPFNVKDVSTRKLGVPLKSFGRDGSPDDVDLDTIEPGEKVASHYCLIGRGTSVIAATAAGYENELVVKFSWQVAKRTGEEEFILKAREVDLVHVPGIFGNAVVVDKTPIAKLRDACGEKGVKVADGEYKVREFRVLVMRKYLPIYELLNDKFWNAIVQLATCVHKLYAKIKLLHQNISITNLAFYEVDGVLIDFDLALISPHQRA